MRLVLKIFILLLISFNAQATQSLDAKHCISVGSTDTGYKDIISYELKNSCDDEVWVHWCLEREKNGCGSKLSWYTQRRALKPNTSYSNWSSLPSEYEIKYGACFGDSNSFIPSGNNTYGCSVESIIDGCKGDKAACESMMSQFPSKGTFTVNCPQGKKDVSFKRVENVMTFKSDLGNGAINLDKSSNNDFSFMCGAEHKTSTGVNFITKNLRTLIKEFDKVQKVQDYFACIGDSQKQEVKNQCAETHLSKYRRLKKFAAVGVRG